MQPNKVFWLVTRFVTHFAYGARIEWLVEKYNDFQKAQKRARELKNQDHGKKTRVFTQIHEKTA